MNDIFFNLLFDTVLNPGATLADVSAMFNAAASVIAPPASAPAPAMSIDALLALPNGFRAAGYEALTITKSLAGN